MAMASLLGGYFLHSSHIELKDQERTRAELEAYLEIDRLIADSERTLREERTKIQLNSF